MNTAPRIDIHHVGNGGTNILLIHGSGSAARPMLRLGRLLTEAINDTSASAVSLAGYGSEPFDLTQPVLHQHQNVLTHALEDEHWHVIGHSMGGYLAMKLALLKPHQIKTLSLIEPMAFGVLDTIGDRDALDQDGDVINAFAEGMENGTGVSHFIEAWNQTPWETLPEPVRLQLKDMSHHLLSEATEISFDRTTFDSYNALTQPLQLICGTESPMPGKRIVERLSSLAAVTDVNWLDGAHHMDVIRAPERFSSVIASHIQQHRNL